MSEALALLARILELEQRQGFTDRAIQGGLDQFLRDLIGRGEVASRTPLEAAILALPRKGYASMDPLQRRAWLQQTLAGFKASAVVTPPARAHSRGAPGARLGAPKRAGTAPDYAARARAGAVTPTPATAATGGLRAPVTVLRSIRQPTAQKLEKLGVQTIEDLLRLYPTRHIDFSLIRPISQLREGEEQTVRGSVWSAKETQIGRRMKGAEVMIGDDTGTVRAVWFNQPYVARQFRPGDVVALAGKPSIYKGRLVFESPEFEVEGREEESIHTGRLVPVYPLTAGLGARTVRRAVKEALDGFAGLVPESLPAEVLAHARLLPVVKALRQVHYPSSLDEYESARRRFAFEELFEIQVAVLMRRAAWRSGDQAPRLRLPDEVMEGGLRSLPFALTGAQRRVTAEILQDLDRTVPMARLLQGDVGSGKTVVAATALIAAVVSGYQGVIMAPTEILAEQHYRTLLRLLAGSEDPPLGGYTEPPWLPVRSKHGEPASELKVALLVGSLGEKEKRDIQQRIGGGDIDIAVGTQALIQETVSFENLGMAIVDEQHRFGVVQRGALRRKGGSPHLMVMSATPIPRTLALTVYGDLDVSVLDEMPPGRMPIKTVWAQPNERGEAYQFLRQQVQQGRQAFIICPLIEESEVLQVRSAVQEYERLQSEVYPDLKLSLVHGRMPTKERDAAMRAFRNGESQVLVATAVIEVGIDIPNATVMMVEGADRFGLAQLHQFRGRVGRGSHPSYCLLLADDPSPEAQERVRLMETLTDGFQLAEADLKLRGPGEYFGTRQSGMPDLRAARLTDTPLLVEARAEAEALIERDPTLTAPELAPLKRKVAILMNRVSGDVH